MLKNGAPTYFGIKIFAQVVIMKVTLEQIAEKAGVSQATASNCLSGRGRAAEQTRLRVLEVAQELGYQKLPRSSSAPTAESVALLLSIDKEWAFGWTFILPIIQELESTLVAAGRRLVLVPIRKDEKELEMYRKIMDIGPAAVVALHYGDSTLFVRLEWEEIPVIVVMNNEFQNAFYSVCVDDYHGAYEGTSYLIELGHRRIGFVGCEREQLHVLRTDRYLGFRKAQQVSRIDGDSDLVIDVDPENDEEVRGSLERLFAREEPPTALFCLDDDLALRVMRGLEMLGIRVPADVSIIAPGDVHDQEAPTPGQKITTMRINTKLLGKTAGEMVLSRLKGATTTMHVAKINQHFVDRGSCTVPKDGV